MAGYFRSSLAGLHQAFSYEAVFLVPEMNSGALAWIQAVMDFRLLRGEDISPL